jgi:hypothetical protein
MMGNPMNNRPTGVMVPQDQLSTGSGSPRTVTRFCTVDVLAVSWVDDGGKEHTEIVHRIGGVWHRAPNGENYAATLKSLAQGSWLSELFERRFREEQSRRLSAPTTPSVSDKDAVDPMDGGDA